MPLSQFMHASGRRIMAGVEGQRIYNNLGRVDIARAAIVGWDESLWGAIKVMVDQTRLWIVVASIDTGGHVHNSRHYKGCAFDTDEIGPVQGSPRPVSVRNPYALALVKYLRSNGWEPYEGGPHPAYLLGPPHTAMNESAVSHDHHCHVSVSPLIPGAASDEAPDLGPEDDD